MNSPRANGRCERQKPPSADEGVIEVVGTARQYRWAIFSAAVDRKETGVRDEGSTVEGRHPSPPWARR